MSTILVVEDEPRIREGIVELLELEGYDVLEASNGKVGVEQAKQHTPDLIICDVMMPEMDGHGMLQALRQHEATMTTPFIFLTARAEKSDLRAGMNLGADDYLTKPFASEDLLAAVATRLKQQAVQQERQEAAVNELRGRLSQVMPHELRTPLVTIMGYSKMLLDDWQLLEGEMIQEMLEDIYQAGERLERFAENYGLYAQLQLVVNDADARRQFFAGHACLTQGVIAQKAMQLASAYRREDDLDLQLDAGMVRVASTYLAKIAEELIDNAFKFSESGTPVVVTGTADPKRYTLRIQDQGRGMSADQQAQIGAFMQFERGHYEQQGLGLGLLLASQLVRCYQGTFTLESTLKQGTTIQLALPTTSIALVNA